MTTTVSACCGAEIYQDTDMPGIGCADYYSKCHKRATPTHSHKTILEYAKENKIKNRRWCSKCGLTEGDIDNGCKHDWKLHLLEDDSHSPRETVSDKFNGTPINYGATTLKGEPTVEKWEEILKKAEKYVRANSVYYGNDQYRLSMTDWLYFIKGVANEVEAHSVQEAKAEGFREGYERGKRESHPIHKVIGN